MNKEQLKESLSIINSLGDEIVLLDKQNRNKRFKNGEGLAAARFQNMVDILKLYIKQNKFILDLITEGDSNNAQDRKMVLEEMIPPGRSEFDIGEIAKAVKNKINLLSQENIS